MVDGSPVHVVTATNDAMSPPESEFIIVSKIVLVYSTYKYSQKPFNSVQTVEFLYFNFKTIESYSFAFY